MKVCEAVAERIENLLRERSIAREEFGWKSGLPYDELTRILARRPVRITCRIVFQIARALHMSGSEFLDSPLFDTENLEK
ncbi:hypothetical protein FACS1894211_10140 [Clostridia bacterium]|nr:hypothetical protein FACS1894211_10140 [Clostridia bacterium]